MGTGRYSVYQVVHCSADILDGVQYVYEHVNLGVRVEVTRSCYISYL
jgi:hypothetical protein